MVDWELDWILNTVASRKASMEEEGKVEDFHETSRRYESAQFF